VEVNEAMAHLHPVTVAVEVLTSHTFERQSIIYVFCQHILTIATYKMEIVWHRIFKVKSSLGLHLSLLIYFKDGVANGLTI